MKELSKIKRKLEELKECTKDKYKTEVIGVFGSYACDEQREDGDKLIHFYFGVKYDIVWNNVKLRLPTLKRA